ncbi:internalin [Lactiplantibacillus fabifermentans T30PCM01]|uniref:Internalin n=2 Tax=Lactiplantibacillus fabifermentans TaxID=483011 RepID=W6T5F9_9LACO|nr:internalin [Lactiplantibacillus fabifermentans T30PCM01]
MVMLSMASPLLISKIVHADTNTDTADNTASSETTTKATTAAKTVVLTGNQTSSNTTTSTAQNRTADTDSSTTMSSSTATSTTENTAEKTSTNNDNSATNASTVTTAATTITGDTDSETDNTGTANETSTTTPASSQTTATTDSSTTTAATNQASATTPDAVVTTTDAKTDTTPTSTTTTTTPTTSTRTTDNQVKTTNKVAVKATLAKMATKTAATVDDSQVVTFADANLAAAVRSALGVASGADITIGNIRHYIGTAVAIGSFVKPIAVSSYSGMEALLELPTNKYVNLFTTMLNNQGGEDLSASSPDLTPLAGIQFQSLALYSAYWGRVDPTALLNLSATKLRNIYLQPQQDDVDTYYQKNVNGMTNQQLAILAPLFVSMSNNADTFFKVINLADNCLTDFSVLSGMNTATDMRIYAAGQLYLNTDPINVVTNQPITFTSNEQIGVDGTYLHSENEQSYSISPEYTYDENGKITGVTWDPAEYLGDGQYYIVSPKQTGNYLTYGQWGYATHAVANSPYYFSIFYGKYNYSLQLLTDAMIYRITNWQTNPTITVNYINRATGEVLQKQVLGSGKQIGDTEDLTNTTTLAGYNYLGTDAPSLNLTYSADPQVVNLYYGVEYRTQVVYVDDTTGQTLHTDELSGAAGTTSGYRTITTIKGYVDQGYELVSDDYPTAGVVFVDGLPVYTVHLQHSQTALNDSKTVSQTIHYVYADGTTAATDHTAKIEFTRTGSHDQVTGTDTWDAWLSTQNSFDAVTSPVIKNYAADMMTVPAVTGITVTSADIETTVTYLVKQGSAQVVYQDATTGQTLGADTLIGAQGTTSDYTTAALIQKWLSQGYVLVSDGYPAGGATFDDTVATYVVQFKHGTTVVNDQRDVTETIHYVYADGTTAATDHQATIAFKRTGLTDNVTGTTTWQNWTSATTSFAAQPSPTINGYTADQTTIAAIEGITPSSDNVELTVTYKAQPVTHGTIKVVYVDQTTGQTLHHETLTGAVGTTSSYQTEALLKQLVAQGYQVVNDGYPTTSVTFNQATQTYTVTVKHATTATTENRTVTRTIHYVYGDGTKAAPDYIATITFTRTKTTDAVTGATTWSAWSSGQTSFAAVASPTIASFKADYSTVTAIHLVTAADADYVTIITYQADKGDEINGGGQPTTPVKLTTPVQPTRPAASPTQSPRKVSDATSNTTSRQSATGSVKTVSADLIQPATAAQTPASARTLPQTDEATTDAASALGLSILTLTSLLGLSHFSRKRRHN